MTELLGPLPVDHCPLVQAETPKVRGPPGRRTHELPDEPDGVSPGSQESFEIKGCAVTGISIELPVPTLCSAFEHHSKTWVPAAELGRALHVVRKKKVFDRVGARACSPAQVGGGNRVDPGVVGGLERAPLLLGESMRHGRPEYFHGPIGSVCAHREIHPW